MRRLAIIVCFAAAASAQVATEANRTYHTEDGRAALARGLGAPDRDKTQRPRDLVALIGVRPGMTVADVGTGVGYMLPHLSEAVGPAGNVFAEDIFDDFLARAKQRAAGLSNVSFIQGTDTDPKLPAALDLILVLDVYHHFDYPEKMLAAFHQALKPGGKLVVVEYYKRRGAMPGGGDRALTHIRLDQPDVIREIEANHFRLAASHVHIKDSQYVLVLEKNEMHIAIRVFAAAALLIPAGASFAADEPPITRKQADEMLNELRQIRQILEKQAKLAQDAARQAQEPQVQKAKLKLEKPEMLGRPDAPLTIVEFTDYQCPFCQRFHSTTFGDLKKNWIDTGKVRFVSKDLPLDFHPNAFRAAEAARCSGDQGQFWRMRDTLASNPSKLGAEDIDKYAAELNLNMPTFRSCMELGKYKDTIQADLKLAQAININGTPSFVIGKTTPEGVEGEVLVGALPLAAFEEKLKALAP